MKSKNVQKLGGGMLIAGLVSVIASFVWPLIMTPEDSWTPQDAEKFTELTRFVHENQHLEADSRLRRGPMHSREPVDPDLLMELREKKQEHEQMRIRLDEARDRPALIASLLRYAGAGLAVVGALLLKLKNP